MSSGIKSGHRCKFFVGISGNQTGMILTSGGTDKLLHSPLLPKTLECNTPGNMKIATCLLSAFRNFVSQKETKGKETFHGAGELFPTF